MSAGGDLSNLEQLLDRIGEAAKGEERVSWDDVMHVVGSRSYGPLLLMAGILTLAPIIGDIPGVPTIIGIFVFLISLQLLLGREHFWLPRFLLDRSVARKKLHTALDKLRPATRFADRLLHPRLIGLTRGAMVRGIAAVCLGIAAAMPAMELVPFSANLAGAALTAFGLSLLAHDGLLASIAFACTAAIVGMLLFYFL